MGQDSVQVVTKKGSFPSFWRFAEFIQKEAKLLMVLWFHPKEESTKSNIHIETKQKVTARWIKTDIKYLAQPSQSQTQSSSPMSQSSNKDNTYKTCSAKGHIIPTLPKFLTFTLDDKKTAVLSLKLCFGCLQEGHRSRDCRSGWPASHVGDVTILPCMVQWSKRATRIRQQQW